jgi:FkbM family methyltransferase
MHASDGQAEIRGGYQLDFGTIETALVGEHGVAGAFVTALDAGSGGPRLIAYVVPDEKVSPGAYAEAALRQSSPDALLALPNGLQVAHLNRAETSFLYKEIFEDRVYERLGVVFRAGACVVDVGANIGMFCLFAMNRCGSPRLLAVEPMPACVTVLELNLKRYGANASVHSIGLSDHVGVAQFRYFPHTTVMSGRYPGVDEAVAMTKYLENKYGKVDPADKAGQAVISRLVREMLEYTDIPCQLDTLSNLIEREGLDHIDVLKIDVEKSEADVLNGIREEHWASIAQIVVEILDNEGRLNQIKTLLQTHGYSCTVSQDALLRGTSLYNLYARREDLPDSFVDLNELGVATPVMMSQRDSLIRQLRRSLPQKLPTHMVPTEIHLVPEIVLTPDCNTNERKLTQFTSHPG